MRQFNFTKSQWKRFEQLCKLVGFKVETDATYSYSNLIETPKYYLRIIKFNKVVCIANLID
jgi:hypothetical protein